MNASEILTELRSLGSEQYKRIMFNHGVVEPAFGVKIEELKKIQKRVKKNYDLARELFDTGIYDAQYLAGLIADETKMTKQDLKRWLSKSNCAVICGNVVAGVAADGAHGWELGLEWIKSKKEQVAATGWDTLCRIVQVTDDAELDIARLKKLLNQVGKEIHEAPNRVRYSMNSFVISVGIYVKSLAEVAMKTAEKIGKVTVDVGNTSCKVPVATEYIKKAAKRGSPGKRRKSARC